ncbi:hypothetical protein AB0K04_03215 [Micromonospora coxensis]|uniref:hypothetical protein n=1 Tax=Micromonospora coxensis TaxID=356852 RepID=UPI0034207760
MTSHDQDRSALFLAMPTSDGLDGPSVAFDGSAEAMRRLRHPFAVDPAGPQRATASTGDDAEQGD